jgi:S1-C subfamily serine protease
LGNPLPAGLYVHKVFKNSLFEKAGVMPGDMIYELNGCALDSHGEASVAWSPERVALFDLISMLVVGQTVNMVLFRSGIKKEITFKMEHVEPFPIRTMYPDYEKVDREVIGGLVVMELALNHLPYLAQTSPDLLNYQKIENTYEPVLIITHILPGSHAQQLRCFVPGDIIESANGIPVTTIAGFREILLSSARSEFLSIKTKGQVLGVFPFKEMLADEIRLATDFVYPLSSIVGELLKLVGNGKQKKS